MGYLFYFVLFLFCFVFLCLAHGCIGGGMYGRFSPMRGGWCVLFPLLSFSVVLICFVSLG